MIRRRHRAARWGPWAGWTDTAEGVLIFGALTALCGVVVWLAVHGTHHIT